MKILAFTDTHGNTRALATIKERVKTERPDVVICLGDLSVFEHQLDALLSRLEMLRVPVIMLHGNHEHEQRMRAACARFTRITFLHKDSLEIDGWTFVAYGGGGFQDEYAELDTIWKQQWRRTPWTKTVFLSHAPPHGTALDNVGEKQEEEWHVGSKTLAKLVAKHQPRVVLSGHIHECFHATDWLGESFLANPGPNGTLYDLDDLPKKRKKQKE